MLAITLGLLKIIGIVLLWLLGLILLALCLLLFVPVRYKAKANTQGANIDVEADGSWLLKFVRLRYIRKAGEDDLRVYIFWFYRMRNDDEEKIETPTIHGKKKAENLITDKLETEFIEHPSTRDKEPTVPEKNAEPKPKQDKGIGRIKEIANQIRYYLNYPNRDIIISATWDLVKRLFKKLRPKKLRLTGEVGFESPHLTGYLFAVLGALCLPISGLKPNFDERILSLNLCARGRLSLWSIVWQLIRYVIKRPIWSLVMDFYKHNKQQKKILRKGDVDE